MTAAENFIGRHMEDMEPQIREFIEEVVTSFIKWDLIKFFHENPGTQDKIINIAKYIGRNVESVASEIDELVESGVLQTAQKEGIILYSYAQGDVQRRRVDKFIKFCKTREGRLKTIYKILNKSGE